MEKSLQEILRENKQRMRYQELKRMKKRQQKETLLAIIVGSFIIIATVGLLILMNNSNDKAIKSCINNGNTYNYCIEHL